MSTTSNYIMSVSQEHWDLYTQISDRSQAYFNQLSSLELGSIEWQKTIGKAEALSELAHSLHKQFQREATLLKELRNTIKQENHV